MGIRRDLCFNNSFRRLMKTYRNPASRIPANSDENPSDFQDPIGSVSDCSTWDSFRRPMKSYRNPASRIPANSDENPSDFQDPIGSVSDCSTWVSSGHCCLSRGLFSDNALYQLHFYNIFFCTRILIDLNNLVSSFVYS